MPFVPRERPYFCVNPPSLWINIIVASPLTMCPLYVLACLSTAEQKQYELGRSKRQARWSAKLDSVLGCLGSMFVLFMLDDQHIDDAYRWNCAPEAGDDRWKERSLSIALSNNFMNNVTSCCIPLHWLLVPVSFSKSKSSLHRITFNVRSEKVWFAWPFRCTPYLRSLPRFTLVRWSAF